VIEQGRKRIECRTRSFIKGRLAWAAVLAILLTTLAACADDDADRRFVNDPLPTVDLVGTPTPFATSASRPPTAIPATPATTEQLLGTTGAVSRLFTVEGKKLLVFGITGGEPSTIFEVNGGAILRYQGSPNGEAVALLIGSGNGLVTLLLMHWEGQQLAQVDLPGEPSTPTAVASGVDRIAWTAAGDRMLISLATGGIFEVTVEGNLRTIFTPAAVRSPKAIAWSPAGSAIAYVDAGTGGVATGLYVAPVDVLPADPVALIPPVEGRRRQIVEISWASGNAGIFYAERAADGDLSLGGDLFAVSPSGGSPRLVASAAGVAQAAAVGTFVVSQDGRAVAYTVITGEADGPVTHSLHVSQLDGPTAIGLRTGGAYRVEQMLWGTSGLTWVARNASLTDPWLLIQRANADGSVTTIFTEAPASTPAAASPVAPGSPVGSPVASSTPLEGGQKPFSLPG
jgi:hypothetical protein